MTSRTMHGNRPMDRTTRAGAALVGLLLLATVLCAGRAVAAPAVPAPTDLTATFVSPYRVDLTWSPVKKATSYQVLRSTAGGTYLPVATTSGLGHSDTTVSPATTYRYVVTASQGGRSSGPSGSVSVTTPPTAPAAPAGLTASAASSSAIDLAWQPSPGATSYTVHLAVAGYPAVGTVAAPTTTLRDAGLAGATTYAYVVRATNSAGTSPDSNTASATTAPVPPPAPPAPPANLQAFPDNYGIYLTWEASSGASGYQVLRGATPGGPYGLIGTSATATPTSYADFPPQHGVSFSYVVRALGGGTTSRNSNEVSAMTAPSSPTDFTARAVDAGPTAGQHVALSWTAPPGAASYVLERGTVGTAYTPLATVTTTFHNDFAVDPSTIYYYRLAAVNGSGSSTYIEAKATTSP